jgi:hypothetical protein
MMLAATTALVSTGFGVGASGLGASPKLQRMRAPWQVWNGIWIPQASGGSSPSQTASAV